MYFDIKVRRFNNEDFPVYCYGPSHQRQTWIRAGSNYLTVSLGPIGEVNRAYYCEDCMLTIYAKIRVELDPKLKAFR